uniref:LOV domain-containing protein n=1 Tax=Pseudictyota dubia TaxID=2749911 RepID=A0A7R9VFN3_9STRA|mmetsp:Transcript_13577/g.25444  ORF Transcript_13577/g.25444 Transcript_13577/m.25444 type:complete len:605 (+) Transcript_13577:209-2023(+)
MAAVSNMMPVSLPRFAPASTAASNAVQKQSDAGMPSHALVENGSGDILDFDMLAEYLLEDGSGATGLPAFDFSSETPPSSDQQQQAGVVSPDQATQFVDPLADAVAEMKKAGGAAAVPVPNVHVASTSQQAATVPIPAPAVAPVAAPVTAPAATPTSVPAAALAGASATALGGAQLTTPAVAPASASATAPAAAPSTAPANAPMPAFQQNSTGFAPAPVGTAVTASPVVHAVAPPPAAPIAAPPTLAPAPIRVPLANSLPQQPVLRSSLPDLNGSPHKRRRIDAAAPLVAAATAAPVGPLMTMNGQILPQAFPQRGGRQKSQAQIDRRRERNRILARRTRLRKKFFFESLQKDVTDLQQENVALKEIVRTRLNPDVAKSLLEDCNAIEELPTVVLEQCGVSTSQLGRQDFNLIQGIQKSQQCFVITDPSLQDNPIVYASDDFLGLTGYSREEVLGRNCRFLQGTETSPAKVAQIRKAVSVGEDCTVTMINYTADGTAFWNSLFIAALRDAQNNIVNFIGVIVKVAGPDPSDPEAGKPLPGEASPSNELSHILGDKHVDSVPPIGEDDAMAVAEAADGTVKAIEGVVTAALVTTPAVNSAATITS